jgi:hypothetical protein
VKQAHRGRKVSLHREDAEEGGGVFSLSPILDQSVPVVHVRKREREKY